jgi:hypothetical protein
MRIDKVRLEELKDSECRGSRAIYLALKAGKLAEYADLYPVVKAAYQNTGKPRGESYIKKEVKGTIKWLTY